MSSSKPGLEPLEPLLAALAHPIRAQVLEILTGRSASAGELAELIGQPPSKIRYHLRALAKSGLISPRKTEDRRGTREYEWLACTPQFIQDEQLSQLSPEQRRMLDRYFLRLIFGDATAGFREDAFSRRPDHFLTRFRHQVDEQGWGELVAVFRSALTDIEGVSGRARQRLEESGEEPVVIAASLLLFDLKAPAQPLSGIRLLQELGNQ